MVTITFCGHAATFFNFSQTVLAIDPWLNGNPICPANLKNPKKIDIIVLTHGHADHASEASSLAKKLNSTILAAWELAMIMIAEGVPETQVVPMNKGGTVRVNNIDITLTNAFHSSSYDSPTGTVYAGEPCGIVLRSGSHSIYHAGDTALFSDMKLIGEAYKPAVALLPIGDRFTMGPKEAAKAASLVGCKQAIPIHYKTFDMLNGTVEEFSSECAKYGVEVCALAPGQTLTL
ncbi:MAG: metal-dependent hydrolase [Proteobacteria bacterium]|nr:MAG: metal-dependent hydrolase [Pseudomonadota bacterium]